MDELVSLPRIGVDFGGVIVQPRARVAGEDTSLSLRNVSSQLPQPEAIESIRTLVELTDGAVWIVSKAGLKMRELTLQWLDANDFYARTGVPPNHIRFCYEREQKREICAELGITHFIDDRVHVMEILRSTVKHLYLFAPTGDKRHTPSYATHVSSWSEVLDRFSPRFRLHRGSTTPPDAPI
jgi:hypothetical protein